MSITKFKLDLKLIEENKGKIVHEGITTDNADGINMTGIGQLLKYVVKIRDGGDEWCIYIHTSTWTSEWIADNGDKVTSESNIKKIVDCSEEVFQLYGF